MHQPSPEDFWCVAARATDHHRFELRPEGRDRDAPDFVQARHPDYFPTVVRHATALFDAAFEHEPRVWQLVLRFGDRRGRLRLPRAARFRRRPLAQGLWLREGCCVVDRDAREQGAVFDRIARGDFPMFQRAETRVVLAGPETGVVLYMYDDRGLVVGAPEGVLDAWEPSAPRIERFRGEDWIRDALLGG